MDMKADVGSGAMRVLLLLAALLAGCLDGPAPANDVAMEEAVPEPFLITDRQEFYFEAGLGAPQGGVVQVNSRNGLSVEVPDGTTALSFHVNWTCGTGDCGLHLYVKDPRGADAGHELGGGATVFSFEDPTPGAWTISAQPDGVAVGVEGTYEVVIEGMALPEAIAEDTERDPA